MESPNEFMKRVKDAVSLPAQTCRALGPESEEDISMYNVDKIVNDSVKGIKTPTRGEELAVLDVVYTKGEKDGK